MTTKVLIVDDASDLRSLVRMALAHSSLEVDIAEASTGREAVRRALKFQPDVIVLDLEMPELSGIEALPALHAAVPEAALLVFTAYDAPHFKDEAMAHHATAFLSKTTPIEELVLSIRRHARGSQEDASVPDEDETAINAWRQRMGELSQAIEVNQHELAAEDAAFRRMGTGA